MDKRLKKLSGKYFDPQGKHRWLAYQWAKAVRKVILSFEGDTVTITEMDARVIAKTAEHLGTSGVGFNPFRGGRAFNIHTIKVSRGQLEAALGG